MADLLYADNLAVSYGPITALRDVSLRVATGEIVAVLGANGAGKSTLLKALIGLVPARAGRIVFEDREITGLATETVVRRGLTLTPEGRHVFAALTVDENLTLGAATLSRADAKRFRAEMFELFPVLGERRKQLAGTLSGGQQQMLAIARSLMARPKLLLLDEPSLGLAPQIVDELFDLILRLRRVGLPLLLVEQNAERALEVANRGYVLAQGLVTLSGPAADLRGAPALERAYLGAPGAAA